jgi:hypothetical protein
MEHEALEEERRSETILHWMVECRETQEVAEVDISAVAGASSSTSLRLTVENCSFWPARQDCRRNCLRKFAPEEKAVDDSRFADDRSGFTACTI